MNVFPIRHGETLLGHMWFVDEDENINSSFSASYYAWDPPEAPGFRFISIDTLSEGGIVEQSIGKAAPWFILAVMLFSYAVRSVYIESCALFVRGGVYKVVKEAQARGYGPCGLCRP